MANVLNEARLRAALGRLEERVREHQAEMLTDYKAVAGREVRKAREDVVKLFVKLATKLEERTAIVARVENESMDPNLAQAAREALR